MSLLFGDSLRTGSGLEERSKFIGRREAPATRCPRRLSNSGTGSLFAGYFGEHEQYFTPKFRSNLSPMILWIKYSSSASFDLGRSWIWALGVLVQIEGRCGSGSLCHTCRSWRGALGCCLSAMFPHIFMLSEKILKTGYFCSGSVSELKIRGSYTKGGNMSLI